MIKIEDSNPNDLDQQYDLSYLHCTASIGSTTAHTQTFTISTLKGKGDDLLIGAHKLFDRLSILRSFNHRIHKRLIPTL